MRGRFRQGLEERRLEGARRKVRRSRGKTGRLWGRWVRSACRRGEQRAGAEHRGSSGEIHEELPPGPHAAPPCKRWEPSECRSVEDRFTTVKRSIVETSMTARVRAVPRCVAAGPGPSLAGSEEHGPE